jgi:hypothetical protein
LAKDLRINLIYRKWSTIVYAKEVLLYGTVRTVSPVLHEPARPEEKNSPNSRTGPPQRKLPVLPVPAHPEEKNSKSHYYKTFRLLDAYFLGKERMKRN